MHGDVCGTSVLHPTSIHPAAWQSGEPRLHPHGTEWDWHPQWVRVAASLPPLPAQCPFLNAFVPLLYIVCQEGRALSLVRGLRMKWTHQESITLFRTQYSRAGSPAHYCTDYIVASKRMIPAAVWLSLLFLPIQPLVEGCGATKRCGGDTCIDEGGSV